MNGKGASQRLVVCIALALAGGMASAKSPHRDAIIGGDANAIIGGDANAIIGGDANAIIGGDANAIIGGDANAIIGGDRRKSSKPSAIIGGDANAIIGGDASAIIGGDANAIIGGDANAIIGGDARKLLAVGPIDSINRKAGTMTVLGQTMKTSAKARTLDAWSAALTAGASFRVAVIGTQENDGTIKPTAVLNLNDQYVAGATKVLLQGRIRAIDYTLGRVTVGNQVVDVTSATLSKTISLGARILVEGIQPAPQGIVLADTIR